MFLVKFLKDIWIRIVYLYTTKWIFRFLVWLVGFLFLVNIATSIALSVVLVKYKRVVYQLKVQTLLLKAEKESLKLKGKADVLKERIKFLKNSDDNWKDKLKQLEQELQRVREKQRKARFELNRRKDAVGKKDLDSLLRDADKLLEETK